VAGEVEEGDVGPGREQRVERPEEGGAGDPIRWRQYGPALEVRAPVVVAGEQWLQGHDVVDAAGEQRDVVVLVDTDQQRALHVLPL
jgi:hypothetical protein